MKVGLINVNNFRSWAYHGWYEEEQILGGEYRTDVELEIAVDHSISDLDDTVNYELVCDVIKNMMQKRCRLIEEVTESIFLALQDLSEQVSHISVTVTKINVPIPQLGSTSFTLKA